MVAYFEGAQSGVFNKKTFNLIRDCLFPDKQHLETSPERRAQFNSALAAFNANAKVLLKPEPRVRPAGQALPTAEEMMRRRGEYDRQQKEKRAKAAAARKARKQPKRALNHVNG